MTATIRPDTLLDAPTAAHPTPSSPTEDARRGQLPATARVPGVAGRPPTTPHDAPPRFDEAGADPTTETPRRITAERFGLTESQLAAFGAELDQLRSEIQADLGQSDVDYIRRVIRVQRTLMVTGRASLFLGWLPPFWLYGAGAMGLAKILDNMEVGHNILHGQYDWTGDPELSSSQFDWDTVCPSDQWKHSHNYIHHTYTNIVGTDRDLGYAILRMSEGKPWTPWDVFNPVKAALLMVFFDHGVMLHDVETEKILDGTKTLEEAWPTLRAGLAKSAKLDVQDYVLWPLLTGPLFVGTAAANLVANLTRNVWAFSIIFCGHFPEGTHEFTAAECDDESKGHWYFRQILGSANIAGGRVFDILSGNLSHQIEHHLFPDLPANRYPQISGRVKEIVERYGIPYNERSFSHQLASTWKKITRLAFPPRKIA